MPSFQITISPTKRAAARFVEMVRVALQKALAEEHRLNGLTQSEIARRVGVHRSVINRELQGLQDMTLGRVAELSAAMGRKPVFTAAKVEVVEGSNIKVEKNPPPSSTDQMARIDADGFRARAA